MIPGFNRDFRVFRFPAPEKLTGSGKRSLISTGACIFCRTMRDTLRLLHPWQRPPSRSSRPASPGASPGQGARSVWEQYPENRMPGIVPVFPYPSNPSGSSLKAPAVSPRVPGLERVIPLPLSAVGPFRQPEQTCTPRGFARGSPRRCGDPRTAIERDISQKSIDTWEEKKTRSPTGVPSFFSARFFIGMRQGFLGFSGPVS